MVRSFLITPAFAILLMTTVVVFMCGRELLFREEPFSLLSLGTLLLLLGPNPAKHSESDFDLVSCGTLAQLASTFLQVF